MRIENEVQIDDREPPHRLDQLVERGAVDELLQRGGVVWEQAGGRGVCLLEVLCNSKRVCDRHVRGHWSCRG